MSSDSNVASHSAGHVHPNYFKIWVTLCVLLGVSVIGPMIGIKALTLIAAFGVAIVKALMVAAYFMHLNIEKKLIWYLLFIVLALMILFFFAIAPDIMNHEGANWRSI